MGRRRSDGIEGLAITLGETAGDIGLSYRSAEAWKEAFFGGENSIMLSGSKGVAGSVLICDTFADWTCQNERRGKCRLNS